MFCLMFCLYVGEKRVFVVVEAVVVHDVKVMEVEPAPVVVVLQEVVPVQPVGMSSVSST